MERDVLGRIFANAILSLPMSQLLKTPRRPLTPAPRFQIRKETARADKFRKKKKILPNGFANVTLGKHNKHTARERKGF